MCDDAAAVDFADTVSVQLDVLAVQRGVPVVGDEHALAPNAEVWCYLAPQLAVFDFGPNLGTRNQLKKLSDDQFSPRTGERG